MAESPEPRASADPPAGPPPATGSGDAELDLLRRLLLDPEQTQIRLLRQRLEEVPARTQDVAEVLPDAIRRAGKRDQGLAVAMRPLVEWSLREAVRRDPSLIVEVVFPVLGPAIRRAVAHALRSFVETLNRIVEQSFTWRGLKWRWEALRTGRSLGEVALEHSLVYRVERVFLIHRETGLLLHSAGPPDVERDDQLISGMLTAIQDFVRDSFSGAEEQELDRLEVGDFQVWIERGPRAMVAAMIRGNPPRKLRERLGDALGAIQSELGERLKLFDGETDPFLQADPHLAACLEREWARPQRAVSPALIAFVTLLAIAVGVWTFVSVRDRQRWRSFLAAAGDEPGLVVLESGRREGRRYASLLRDPLAADPSTLLAANQVEADDVVVRVEPYQALDPEIVLLRAQRLLETPASVELTLADRTLRASGSAGPAWRATLLERGPWIGGVDAVDAVELQDEIELLAEELRGLRLLFPTASSTPAPDQAARVQAIGATLDRALEAAERNGVHLEVEVVGRTDPSGGERINRTLSLSRAAALREMLVASGVPAAVVATRGLAPETAGESPEQMRAAWVEIGVGAGERRP